MVRLLKLHTVKKGIALPLMMLLMSTLLVKPVHVVLAHHDHGCYTDNRNTSLSHKDCDICQFVFSNYIPQQNGNFTPYVYRPYITLAEYAEAYHTTQSIRFFSLRAPPTTV